MFQSHMMTHQAAATASAAPTSTAYSQKLPPIQRPEVKQDISEEDWDAFMVEWTNFKRCTNLPSTNITDQLYQCCERSLARLLIKEQPDIVMKDEDTLLDAMKRLSVIKVATSVRRSKLLSTRQSHGEGFREFYANVKAAAATCDFKVKCPNTCCRNYPPVDYTANVIKDVIVLGIVDPDIQRDVLAWEELDEKDDKAVVAFVESKELAQNAWMSSQSSASTAGLSSYRRENTQQNSEASIKTKLAMKGKCLACKKEISLYKKFQTGSINRKPHTLCPKCFKSKAGQRSKVSAIQATEGGETSDSAAVGSFFLCANENELDGAQPLQDGTGQLEDAVVVCNIEATDGFHHASALDLQGSGDRSDRAAVAGTLEALTKKNTTNNDALPIAADCSHHARTPELRSDRTDPAAASDMSEALTKRNVISDDCPPIAADGSHHARVPVLQGGADWTDRAAVAGTLEALTKRNATNNDALPIAEDCSHHARAPELRGDRTDPAAAADMSEVDKNVDTTNPDELFTAADPGMRINAVVMEHHVFAETGWKNVQSPSHPTLSLRLSVDASDYAQFGYKCPEITPTKVKVIVDSGAQSVLWSRREYLSAGFTMNDLIPVKHNMKAANGVNIQIDGAVLIRLSGKLISGDPISCAVMAYVSPDANYLYLSKEAMIQLRIIDPEFPKIGAVSSNQVSGIDEGTDYESVYAECGCLKREMPPEKPSRLPFDPSQENDAAGMKEWLLSRYASSTFNKCPHQLLPLMDGPPIEIHIDKNAKPVAFLKPRPVALHWQKKIEEDLLRDVSLGVIERVPHGEPTSWCFPMLAARKDDGSPRRLVDLSPLNKFCKREVHTSKSPFNLAKSVPSNSLKTVVDAWNGYHAIPVKESDRQYLTFATNLGLFRYMRAPQGFLSSGDGYNRRLDDLTSHIQRLERCVDDSLLHDKKEDVDQHWWRVIEYLELCGKSGIVLNPEKFQFSLSTVDFAGFRISEDTVEPLPKYLDAIRGFPTPCTIRDIRSWFGLVHQVAHYAQLRDMLEPFKKFLSPKVKFEWNAELDAIFERSKLQIIDAIKQGVQIYDMTKRTCLRTDWSRSGIGYLLAQKHCHCKGGSYGCCPDGWRITLAGSRFLTPAEKNYAPIEGEALAVAWALKQTEFFTQGCDNLVVVVDHKPLVKILGDRRLDEIENSRLFRIKWKTLNWRFDIEYQRGERNPFADAMSRNPNTYAELAASECNVEV